MLVENRPLWPLNLNAQGGAVHIISAAEASAAVGASQAGAILDADPGAVLCAD
jgi:hypothetical protein